MTLVQSPVGGLASIGIFGQVADVTNTILQRTLWYSDGSQTHVVDESFLQTDSRSLVVLGEAGMGKSTLLAKLDGVGGYERCTARALINRPDVVERFGDAQTLVIDALDEVPAHGAGDAVDQVVAKLAALKLPRFILACRVADWRSATALQGLRDLYETDPLQLHIEPLERPDAVTFLTETLGDQQAEATTQGLEKKGLAGLWSNPQTLGLVQEVARAKRLPTSKGELFNEATKLLRREHREEKAGGRLAQLSEADVLDAAGAAFAALILTGKEAISTKATVSDDDVAASEVKELPAGLGIRDVLGSRLFVALEPERFTYAHRAIGEYLGARWLARQADTGRKRRRLHALFVKDDLVPASLRGLHAWLAWHSPELAVSAIAADPLGVVQYGDVGVLSTTQAQGLLAGLEKAHPNFAGWSEIVIGGFAQPALLSKVRELLSNAHTAWPLKRILLRAFEGSALVAELADLLRKLALDQGEPFGIRSDAAERLVESARTEDWPEIVSQLIAEGGEDGVRLALELTELIGYAVFEDDLLVRMVVAQLGQSTRTIGLFFSFVRNLPGERIDVILDAIAALEAGDADRDDYDPDRAITDLAYELLARRLAYGPTTPEKVASWLAPFDVHSGVDREARDAVSRHFSQDVALRRAVQRHVVLDQPGEMEVWGRYWRMVDRSNGLQVNEDDVIALLDHLETTDRRWRDVLRLGQHNETEGTKSREVAQRFAGDDDEALSWLAELPIPVVPEWKVKQQEREDKRRREREANWAKHRKGYAGRIEQIRAGHYGAIVEPAKAYLNLFYDIGDKTDDGPGRVTEWLGPEICEASLAGFDAFLTASPPKPTAAEIAESHAESRHWDAAYIVVAALAERLRTGRGFDDLPDERLMAGLCELMHAPIDSHAGLPDLGKALADALRGRGCWEAVQRLFLEPQFAAGAKHVSGLYAFVREERDKSLAVALAIEWLKRFPAMACDPEGELIDLTLVTPAARDALRRIMRARRARPGLDDERRRNWDAVGVLIDFEQVAPELVGGGPVEEELLWHIRARLGGRRDDPGRLQLDAAQPLWLLDQFRIRYPMCSRPTGVSSGDTNAWDAADFVVALINRLGNDASPEAIVAMKSLSEREPDGYSDHVKSAAAEQKRKAVETGWRAPELATVRAAVTDGPPTTALQLQQVMCEELEVLQRKLRGADVDYYKAFWDGDTPRNEEHCRDEILKMLRPVPFEIHADPEGHLADDKRADIICQLGAMMTPIEIKGQWHPELWTAADHQLERLYVNDWRAEAGIYLVLWFGAGTTKPLKRPPGGAPAPTTPEALQSALTAGSAQAQTGRVKVVVLDLVRPQ